MAFTQSTFRLMAPAFAEGQNTKWIKYDSTTDAHTVVGASAYFPATATPALAVNDIISVTASDGPQLLYVTSLAPIVTADLVDATVNLPANSVTTAMIQALAVTDAKVATGLNGNKIQAGTIQPGAFAASAIATADVAALAITDAKINDVNGGKIASASIVAGKYSAGSIIDADIGGVSGSKIAAASIPTGSYVAGSIATADVAALAVTRPKLAVGIIPIFTAITNSTNVLTQSVTATGVVATDVVTTKIHTVGAIPRTITSVAAGTDVINITWSGLPAVDHKVNIICVRP
tara:strand:+ start:80 stop:952 length:873 start_codon:yes stop_codon:yes gene_type:complete